jgi:hypothetical protein
VVRTVILGVIVEVDSLSNIRPFPVTVMEGIVIVTRCLIVTVFSQGCLLRSGEVLARIAWNSISAITIFILMLREFAQSSWDNTINEKEM